MSKLINTGFTTVDKALNSGIINRNALAALMFPTNSNPGQYLYKKLHRKEGQSFTTSNRKEFENILRKYLTDII